MTLSHVVIDGSNIATEGRTLPSLTQLDEAVRAFIEEYPAETVTVVVDATFEHRIEDDERQAYEEAELAGELVSPPAGAIGRGDAFILRIADKTGAIVFSNDSFQEFHGEYEWLFERGRLIGGKPVQGVGWIFTDRTPVRGPKSREAVKDAKRKKAVTSKPEKVLKAIKVAVEEAVDPQGKGRARRGRRSRAGAGPPTGAINEPLVFIQFVADFQPGATVEGTVDKFASHGAFVSVGKAQCYIPLSAMGNPAPSSARSVLNKGETRSFVVQAVDAPRRGIELAFPGVARPRGGVTEETVEAEITERAGRATARRNPARRNPARSATSPRIGDSRPAPVRKAVASKAAATTKAPTTPSVVSKSAATKKLVAKKSQATKSTAAKSSVAKKAVKTTVVKKVAAKAVKKAAKTVKATAAKKVTAVKKTAVKKTAVTKATRR